MEIERKEAARWLRSVPRRERPLGFRSLSGDIRWAVAVRLYSNPAPVIAVVVPLALLMIGFGLAARADGTPDWPGPVFTGVGLGPLCVFCDVMIKRFVREHMGSYAPR
jgi:hypothetical protein